MGNKRMIRLSFSKDFHSFVCDQLIHPFRKVGPYGGESNLQAN